MNLRLRAAAFTLLAGLGCGGVQVVPGQTPGSARVYSEEEVRAVATEMSSFLFSLAQRQQEFFRTENRFASGFAELELPRPGGFDVRITEGSDRGWAAEASRANPRVACSIFVGVVSALPQPNSMVQSRAAEPYCTAAAPGP